MSSTAFLTHLQSNLSFHILSQFEYIFYVDIWLQQGVYNLSQYIIQNLFYLA